MFNITQWNMRWNGLQLLSAADAENAWKVRCSARVALVGSLTLLCVVLPLMQRLSVTKKFYKLEHNFNHHFVYQHLPWLHDSQLYHNRSIHIGVFWTAFVAALTLYGTAGDLKHIAKRAGRIAIAFLPGILILTLRPSPLPNMLYLWLLPYHKWISRVLLLESFLHCILYVWWFSYSQKMGKLLKFRNVCGVLAFFAFFVIGISSVSKVRRQNFKLFYYIHYTSTWASVILLYLHSKPSIFYYFCFCVAILLYQILFRVTHTKRTRITITCISPTISLLEFPKEYLSNKPVLPATHVRLGIVKRNLFSNLLNNFVIPFQHPFTIASLPNDDTIQLIVRNGKTLPLVTNNEYYVTGCFEPMIDFISKASQHTVLSPIFDYLGFTSNDRSDHNELAYSASVEDTATSNILSQLLPSLPFQVNSLPLLNSPLRYKINATRVFMVVGGTAISFALPVLRILNFNGVHTRLIWVTRDYKDLQLLNHFKNNFEGLEVFISGKDSIDYIEEYNRLQERDADSRSMTTIEGNIVPTENHTEVDTENENENVTEAEIENENENVPLLLNNNKTTFGSIADKDDEVDFTETFSRKKSKKKLRKVEKLSKLAEKKNVHKNVFREQTVIEPPTASYITDDDIESASDMNVSTSSDRDPEVIPAVTPNITRPKLKKIRIPAGIKVSFGRPVLNNSHYNWCLEKECIGPSETNLCCHPNSKNSSHVDDLTNVWVVAAGPHSLIENTHRWATDGGLHFYAEAFAV